MGCFLQSEDAEEDAAEAGRVPGHANTRARKVTLRSGCDAPAGLRVGVQERSSGRRKQESKEPPPARLALPVGPEGRGRSPAPPRAGPRPLDP